MAYRVDWTDSAWQEIEAAAKYIARDSPHFASALINEARLAPQSLKKFPQRGRIVPELRDASVREIFDVDVNNWYILIQHESRYELFRRNGELLQTWNTAVRLRLFN